MLSWIHLRVNILRLHIHTFTLYIYIFNNKFTVFCAIFRFIVLFLFYFKFFSLFTSLLLFCLGSPIHSLWFCVFKWFNKCDMVKITKSINQSINQIKRHKNVFKGKRLHSILTETKIVCCCNVRITERAYFSRNFIHRIPNHLLFLIFVFVIVN